MLHNSVKIINIIETKNTIVNVIDGDGKYKSQIVDIAIWRNFQVDD